jgi:hypothetical protein
MAKNFDFFRAPQTLTDKLRVSYEQGIVRL